MTPVALGNRAVGFPVALTPLIGRDHDVADVRALLRNPDVHLVSLVGPGGVGKTRLAADTASGLASEFPDGAYFVSLTSVSDHSHVALTIASAFGIRERSDRQVSETLVQELSSWSALIVIDNFEHVDRAVPLVSHLLETCADLTILVTSRSSLRIRGEHVYLVSPLAIPVANGGQTLNELKGHSFRSPFLRASSCGTWRIRTERRQSHWTLPDLSTSRRITSRY